MIMHRYLWVCTMIAVLATGLMAQPGQVEVTKNFRFREGIFLSHQAFRSNTPDLTWDQVDAALFTNPQTYVTQVQQVRLDPAGAMLSPDSIWGICIQGIPYVRLQRDWIQKELATFAPLELRGKICYFDFDKKDTIQVLMTAFNPANGLPFRRGLVDREVEVSYPKILHFETGEILDFTKDNLLLWIGDDPGVVEAVEAISDDELESKLFKALLIYVDRNSAYIH